MAGGIVGEDVGLWMLHAAVKITKINTHLDFFIVSLYRVLKTGGIHHPAKPNIRIEIRIHPKKQKPCNVN
jgi:hypothetical protein